MSHRTARISVLFLLVLSTIAFHPTAMAGPDDPEELDWSESPAPHSESGEVIRETGDSDSAESFVMPLESYEEDFADDPSGEVQSGRIVPWVTIDTTRAPHVAPAPLNERDIFNDTDFEVDAWPTDDSGVDLSHPEPMPVPPRPSGRSRLRPRRLVLPEDWSDRVLSRQTREQIDPFVKQLNEIYRRNRSARRGGMDLRRQTEQKALLDTVRQVAAQLNQIDPKSRSRSELAERLTIFLMLNYPDLQNKFSKGEKLELAKAVGSIKKRGPALSAFHYDLLEKSWSARGLSNEQRLEIAREVLENGSGTKRMFSKAARKILLEAEGTPLFSAVRGIVRGISQKAERKSEVIAGVVADIWHFQGASRSRKETSETMQLLIAASRPSHSKALDEILAVSLGLPKDRAALLRWIDQDLPKLAKEKRFGELLSVVERLSDRLSSQAVSIGRAEPVAEVLAHLAKLNDHLPKRDRLSQYSEAPTGEFLGLLNEHEEIVERVHANRGLPGVLRRVGGLKNCDGAVSELTIKHTEMPESIARANRDIHVVVGGMGLLAAAGGKVAYDLSTAPKSVSNPPKESVPEKKAAPVAPRVRTVPEIQPPAPAENTARPKPEIKAISPAEKPAASHEAPDQAKAIADLRKLLEGLGKSPE